MLTHAPRRVMRSRKKGVKLPENAIYVGRPTVFGNPFMVARFGHLSAVNLHRRWLTIGISALRLEAIDFCPAEIDTINRFRIDALAKMPRLRGRDLACWCSLNGPCHADTLMELAA
jgi:hypothetical protein